MQSPQQAREALSRLPLRQKQARMTLMVARLVLWAYEHGYELTFGDAYRDPRVFGAMGVRQGYGESRSAHKQRLAVDLNLFRDGQFLSGTADHAELGAQWELMGGVWGGRFNDGNHYSIEHEGVM